MSERRLARFGSHATERRWPSLIVSLAVSVGLFIAAFASMTSLPSWVRRDRTIGPNLPVLVRIPTPPRPSTPVAPKTTRAPNRAANPRDRPHVPASDKVAPVVPSPVDTGLAPPAEPTTARDSSGARSTSAARGSIPSTSSAGAVRGAPIAPAGVTYDHRAANTPEVRDSIARGVMDNIAELARTRAPTGRELAELETRAQRDFAAAAHKHRGKFARPRHPSGQRTGWSRCGERRRQCRQRGIASVQQRTIASAA